MRIRSLDPCPVRTAEMYPRWNLGNRRRETSLALAAAHARVTGRPFGYRDHPEAAWTAAHARYTGLLLLAILDRVREPAPLLPHVREALDWALAQPDVRPSPERCASERADYLRRYGAEAGRPPRVLPADWP